MAECFSRGIVEGRQIGVLTNHARVGSIPAGGSVMIIRVSGQFTQILRLWMEQYAIDCPSLHARVAALVDLNNVIMSMQKLDNRVLELYCDQSTIWHL
tara:strand:- start:13225 stop:13518 length:294 start_codon:yes stop_codon:yes gene_type:complete